MEINNLYSHFQTPPPKTPYKDRLQKRLAWRNERTLYRVKCDLTGNSAFSIYSSQSPFPIYSPDAWYSDEWDALDYGQDFDFSRPFFEQFYELQCKVPRISNIIVGTTNCDYCNIIGYCKNCYLIFGSINCEDCLYGSPFNCKSCIDSLLLRNSEFCYQCIDSDELYECFYCQNCFNSRGLHLCFDLQGCQDCFLCAGLTHKTNNILNRQYSKEEYEIEKARLLKLPQHELEKMLEELKLKIPHKFMEGINNENVVGDHVINSKNCQALFNSEKCEEVSYSTQILEAHHCLDCDYGEIGSYNINTSGFNKSSNLFCCHWVWSASDLFYCSLCGLNTNNCFGCISLKHKQYCILNKQYTKEQYQELLPKIIAHMKSTGEWGEFFPIQYSPSAYNETIAQEYFPLSEQEVRERGWKWIEKQEPQVNDFINSNDLPDISIAEDSIANKAIKCPESSQFYKITPFELNFLKRFNLQLPRFHPDVRHQKRLSKRNKRDLHERTCNKCSTKIISTYPQEAPETIYCETCYLQERY